MILISLDEQGDFENAKFENKPIFIAGVLFDNKNEPQEEFFERKRIRSYYEAVIDEASKSVEDASGFEYPEALHSDGDKGRDTRVIRPVKDLVKKTLPEFIQKGTYKGAKLTYTNSQGASRVFTERKGQYYVFCILRSDDGLEKYMVDQANVFSRDDYAHNLYFHMSSRIVNRLLLHNPIIENVNSASLNIATRSSKTLDYDSQEASIYRKQGYDYQTVLDDSSKVYFSLANADIYRSMIATEMLHCEKTNLKIESFMISSINYKKKHGKTPRNMEFLYLSDSICSILGYQNNGANAHAWLDSIHSRIKNISGDTEGIVFMYDEVDVIFDQAWIAFEEGDIYRSLGLIWNGCRKNVEYSSYYKKHWFSILEERIRSKTSLSDYMAAVLKLSERRFSNTYSQDKGLYIYKQLVSMIPNMEPKFRNKEDRKILYKLFDSGISVYTHIGDTDTAEMYFNKCREFAYYINVEEYLDTKNRMVVNYTDSFRWDKALDLAEENINYHDYLIDMKKEIGFPDYEEDASLSRSIAYSQLGQILAFSRQERAEECFREALRHFAENSDNYKITQSYLLHYYLEMNMGEQYKQEVRKYFGDEGSLSRQFKYILNEGCKEKPLIHMKFALYVYIKGLYKFYLNQISDELWNKLVSLEAQLRDPLSKFSELLTGHPMELIYKYMAMIAQYRNDNDAFLDYYKKSQNVLLYFGPVEIAINMFSRIEMEVLQGNTEESYNIINDLFSFMQTNFQLFQETEAEISVMGKYQMLLRYFTFMYR